jgi:hypothetical protein
MALKIWLLGSAAVLASTAMAANAEAGPVGGLARELVPAAMSGTNVQQVATRVCWNENGSRRCRSLNNVRVYGYQSPRASGRRAPAAGYIAPPVGYYGYLPTRDQIETDPNAFPVGSSDWWQAMDALDRGGQGNGQGSQ